MIVLAIFVTAALCVIVIIALDNAICFPRLQAKQSERALPAVSILVPARNEARDIAGTIDALQKQDYPQFEIVALDDCSTDATAQVIAAKADDGQTRLIAGNPLPSGWIGKNWACHQLAEQAQYNVLVFTDADVCWHQSALRAVIEEMLSSRADLITVWPTQTTRTWPERLVVPLMSLAVMGYLPVQLAHDSHHPLAAAANGQCMVFDADIYHNIGGHKAVRDRIVEDVELARLIKRRGYTLRMVDACGLISCRMYRGWVQLFDGYAKNIIAGHGNSLLFLGFSTLFHLLLFVWPWIWLLMGQGTIGWPLWPILLAMLGIAARTITAAASGQRTGDALLMPISVLLMTTIAAHAVSWRISGGPRWKGRTLHT